MIRKLFLSLVCGMAAFQSGAQTTLPTSWNFSAPGIASPPTGWSYNLSIGGTNTTYSFGVGDALSCRLDATGEYVLIHFADKPGALSYYLSPQNAGAAWGGQFDIQESSNGTSWTTVRSVTSKASTATNFTGGKYTDNLNQASRYVRFFYTSKLPGGQPTPGGNMALDSVLIQTAPPPATPVINIKQGTATVINNGQYVVGTAAATVFTIENKGTQDSLVIGGSSLSGTAATDYSVSGLPVKIAAGASANFTLNFTAGANGSRLAKLTVTSNDSDKASYTINLYGIGGQYATEPAGASGNLQFSGVKPFGFTATFSQPVNKPEYYVVLAKRGAAVTEVPVDGQTYKKGDYIGAAQVALVGTDTTFTPTYILSGYEYFYKVFPFNGPAGYQNYFTSGINGASVIPPAGNAGSYYAGIYSASSNFLTQLHNKINPHDTVFYSAYISRVVNPFLTRDTTGGKKVVNCVYTGQAYVYDEPFVWWNGTNSGILTREHTFAQSWMPTDAQLPGNPEFPEYNDVHNLFPADQANANGKRSNYPFGEIVGTPTFVSPTGLGKLGKDAANNTVWEPRDDQKGDLARALFYMLTCYNGVNGNNWRMPATQSESVLKKWHFQDLPDALEKSRQELIYELQRNRNPFIDSPNFACRINFTNMTWISNPGACGVAQINLINPDSVVEDAHDFFMLPIQWSSMNVDSVNIYVIRNGITTLIAGPVASGGLYNWGCMGYVGDSLQIKIADAADSTVFSSSVKFKLIATLGVDAPAKLNVQVYPNPSAGVFVITTCEKQMEYELYNIAGALLEQKAVHEEKTTVSTPYPGVYILVLRTPGGVEVIRLISE